MGLEPDFGQIGKFNLSVDSGKHVTCVTAYHLTPTHKLASMHAMLLYAWAHKTAQIFNNALHILSHFKRVLYHSKYNENTYMYIMKIMMK